MFVDACAIVALLAGEATAPAYETALNAAQAPWTSPLAVWEAIIVIARPGQLDCTFGIAMKAVLSWLENRNIALRQVADANAVLRHAVAVAQLQGVGRRGLSALDCFHYAYAKSAGAVLLTLDERLRATDVATRP